MHMSDVPLVPVPLRERDVPEHSQAPLIAKVGSQWEDDENIDRTIALYLYKSDGVIVACQLYHESRIVWRNPFGLQQFMQRSIVQRNLGPEAVNAERGI